MGLTNLETKAKKLIKEYNMVENGGNILVAFSGGSDSSALLFFLTENYPREKICAAHMNHMIRGVDADSDEKFAVETCGKYNVKIFTERKNIPEIAKESKKSIEEAARDERYDFFRRVAGIIGGSVKIATAHTASDNTETVIFNLSRGCGLNGLCGIAPVNKNIIRPFLSCSKEDILEYCEKNNIAYVEDKTNADENYTRNFIRGSIASKLKERFNNLDENIFKTTEIIRDTVCFHDLCAENIVNRSNGADIDFLAAQHKPVRRAVIAKLYENAVFPDARKLEYRHVLYVEGLLKTNGVRPRSIDLPGFVTVSAKSGKLVFEKITDKKTSGYRA